ncbi:MAG: sigma-70 family RNA polymerase sigma factor [Bacteroidia bacterium]|nr:sigma-70 family RNA polymerase sigma factor [Bacteroidia bacterium]MCZ2248756.1 sigma-70 family RNA polymerase sigma factor [Bacteroidia bacterium]
MEIENNLSEKARYDYNLVLLAVEQGDQKAYAELMERYKESVYFMLLKMVSNKDDADDLTIETFGKAFSRLSQYTPNFAFSTWLFKIATNNCIDFIRKKRNNSIVSLDKSFENEEGGELSISVKFTGLDPEENVIRKQKNVIMRDIVEKLKPKYRTLVEMRYFEELSYEEISEKLNLPLGTVKAQLFRARDLLYNILKNNQYKI